MLDLDRIQAYCDAATEGPWMIGEQRQEEHYGDWLNIVDDGYTVALVRTYRGCGPFPAEEPRAVADFIAQARTDIPLLLKVVDCLSANECALCALQGRGKDYRDCWYAKEAGPLSRCIVGAALAELEAGE